MSKQLIVRYFLVFCDSASLNQTFKVIAFQNISVVSVTRVSVVGDR